MTQKIRQDAYSSQTTYPLSIRQKHVANAGLRRIWIESPLRVQKVTTCLSLKNSRDGLLCLS